MAGTVTPAHIGSAPLPGAGGGQQRHARSRAPPPTRHVDREGGGLCAELAGAAVQDFECVVCNKVYRSDKALKNHEASKKHKEALKRFKRVMHAEDALGLADLAL